MISTVKDFCEYLFPRSGRKEFYLHMRRVLLLWSDKVRSEKYRRIEIAKQNGGLRVLYAPDEELKWVQRRLLALLSDVDLPACATGYRRGMSLRDGAAPHLGHPLLVKLDIEAFFDRISVRQLFDAIDNALRGLPRFGVHLADYDAEDPLGNHYNNELSYFFTKLCTREGKLPQGAPTSPFLSNLVFAPLDREIQSYCEQRHVVYTRYSDDMTFSGNAFHPEALMNFVSCLLKRHGFRLNRAKTVVAGAGSRHRVTGVLVNEKLQVDAAFRRKIRQEMYYIQKFGVRAHLLKQNDENYVRNGRVYQKKYLDSLLGRIGFVLQINPHDGEFQNYKHIVHRLR